MIIIQSMKNQKKVKNQLENPEYRKEVLHKKAQLSIKQRRSYNKPKDKDVLPKKFFDPNW